MTTLRNVLIALAKIAVACGLLWVAYGIGDAEVHRAEPSTIRLALAAGVGLLGLLIAPTISDVVVTAAQRGISLGAAGRRAYDGTVVPTEEPKP